jgi:hypothetical protein
VTLLRRAMPEELQRRNYAKTTVYYDLTAVERFAKYFHTSPDQLNQSHLRQYQAYLLRERKLGPRTVKLHVSRKANQDHATGLVSGCEQSKVFVLGQQYWRLRTRELEDGIILGARTSSTIAETSWPAARRAVTTAKSQLSSARNRTGYSRADSWHPRHRLPLHTQDTPEVAPNPRCGEGGVLQRSGFLRTILLRRIGGRAPCWPLRFGPLRTQESRAGQSNTRRVALRRCL